MPEDAAQDPSSPFLRRATNLNGRDGDPGEEKNL